MRTTFNTFSEELNQLVQYINQQIEFNDLIVKLKNDANYEVKLFEQNIAKNKIYRYNSYIITLYGLFERFIENMIKDYLNELSQVIPEYKKLPPIIKDNNIRKNAQLLSSLHHLRNKNIDYKELIKTLNQNVNANLSGLYSEAFIRHSSNFRISSLSEIFNNVDIVGINSKLIKYQPLKQLLEQQYRNISNHKPKTLFSIIDDLANRRNDVAHGVENIYLLHPSIILDYINYISCFSGSLITLIEDSLLKHRFNSSENLEILKVHNHSILCFKHDSCYINKKSKIIIKYNNVFPEYQVANVLEIQINGKSFNEIDINEPCDIAIKLNKRINVTNSFVLQNKRHTTSDDDGHSS